MTALNHRLNPIIADSLPRDPIRPDRSEVLSISVSQRADQNWPHTLRLRTLSGKFTVYPDLWACQPLVSDASKFDPRQNLPNGRDRHPRGWNGLPRSGRELIEDGLVLLHSQARAKGHALVFWTFTIPTRYQDGSLLSEADHWKILVNWSTLVKRVFGEVSRELARLGLPQSWVYVVEPQEKRWERDRVFAPHVHTILPNQWDPKALNPSSLGFRSGYWKLTTSDLDDILTRCYTNLLGKLVDCSTCGQTDSINRLRKLGEYLSKLRSVGRYLSKGSSILSQLQSSPYAQVIPRTWYGADLQTKRVVRSSVVSLSLGATSLIQARANLERLSLEFQLDHDRPLFTPLHTVEIEDDDGTLPVAVCGRIWRSSDCGIALDLICKIVESTQVIHGYSRNLQD